MTRGMGDDCKPIAASDTGRHAVGTYPPFFFSPYNPTSDTL